MINDASRGIIRDNWSRRLNLRGFGDVDHGARRSRNPQTGSGETRLNGELDWRGSANH